MNFELSGFSNFFLDLRISLEMYRSDFLNLIIYYTI